MCQAARTRAELESDATRREVFPMKSIVTRTGPVGQSSALRRRAILLLFALLSWLGAVGCADVSVRASAYDRLDPAAIHSYGWIAEDGASADPDPDPEQGSESLAELFRDIRLAVDENLAGRGLALELPERADVLLAQHVRIDRRVRNNDPSFGIVLAERVEEGTLTLEVTDRVTGELLWSGTGWLDLRIVARAMQPSGTQLVAISRERDWKLPDTVGAILAEFPRSPR